MTMNGLNIDYRADTSLSPPRRCGLSVTQKIIQFSFICTNNSHLKATDVVLIYNCIQLLLFFKAGTNQNEPFHLPTYIGHKPK